MRVKVGIVRGKLGLLHRTARTAVPAFAIKKTESTVMANSEGKKMTGASVEIFAVSTDAPDAQIDRHHAQVRKYEIIRTGISDPDFV